MLSKKISKIIIVLFMLLIITTVTFGDRINELYNNKKEVDIISEIKFKGIVSSIIAHQDVVKTKLSDDYSKYELALGYRLYTLNYEKMVNSDTQKIEELLKPLDRWEYVVTYEDKPISVVTVAKKNDEYKIVKMGGYNKSNIRFNNIQKLTTDKYTDIKLILLHPAYTTYIVKDKHGKYKVLRETDPKQEKKEFKQYIKDLRSTFKENRDNKKVFYK